MTKKHFIAIAETIRKADFLTEEQKGRLANGLAVRFFAFNDNFSGEKFVSAATLQAPERIPGESAQDELIIYAEPDRIPGEVGATDGATR